MKTVKLQAASSQFRKYLKENNRSSATIIAYGKDIDQLVGFLQELHKLNAEEVTTEDISAFLAKMSKNNYTAKSVSRKLNSLRTFYRFLKANEYVDSNPSLLVSHPSYQLAPPRILTPTEYRALRDAARNDPRMFAIIELLLQTGIRIGELATLKLSDIRKDSLFIRPVEKHEARTVQLNKRAKEALNRYLEVKPKNNQEHLFITKSGRPFLIRNIRTAIERYLKLAEIKNAKVNDLRHTFAAHHLKHGVSLVIISKALGHKTLSTTERYLEYVKDRSRETAVLSEL